MKKILALTAFPAPYRSELFLKMKKNLDIDVFFETDNEKSRDSKWFVDSETFWYINSKLGKKKFIKSLRNIKKYGCVCLYEYSTFISIILAFICITKKVPFIINCDGVALTNRGNIVKRKIKKFIISHATKCFSSGEYAKKYFLDLGAKESNIIIHNFSTLHNQDILQRPYSLKEKLQIRNKLNIEESKIVLAVGRFIFIKGFDVLLESCKELSKDVGIYFVGGEPTEEYKDFVRNNNLSNVHFVGFKKKEELKQYYFMADVFVLPTREDVWGLVINEAMAFGLPVITTDMCVAGLELIEDDKNGYIVKIDNSIELANRIRDLIFDDELCRKMANNNIEKIRNYTIENMEETQSKAILQILS